MDHATSSRRPASVAIPTPESTGRAGSASRPTLKMERGKLFSSSATSRSKQQAGSGSRGGVDISKPLMDGFRDWATGTQQQQQQQHEVRVSGVPLHTPFKPYPAQLALMAGCIRAFKSSTNALLESPTGAKP